MQSQTKITRRSGPIGIVGAILLGASVPLWLSAVDIPNSFTNGDVADADEVNANFEAVSAAFTRVAIVTEEVSTGTAGPSLSSGASVRALNTLRGDTSFASVASSQVTLDAGTYRVDGGTTAYKGGANLHWSKAYLYDASPGVTAPIVETVGPHVHGNFSTNDDKQYVIPINGVFTLTQQSPIELRMYHSNGGFETGGRAANDGVTNEVYSKLVITKLD